MRAVLVKNKTYLPNVSILFIKHDNILNLLDIFSLILFRTVLF